MEEYKEIKKAKGQYLMVINNSITKSCIKIGIMTWVILLMTSIPVLSQSKYICDGIEYTLYVQDAIEYTLNDDGTAIVSKHTDKLPSNVIIPSKITYLNKEYTVTSIGEFAFFGCENIVSVTIPESITTIEYNAFDDCSNLFSITIPNNVSKIGNNAFEDCASLTTVTLNEGLLEIGSYAFANCKNLLFLSIPNSVMRIGISAFKEIANVNYKGYASGKPWDAKTINGTIDGDFVYSDTAKTQLTAYLGKGSDVNIPFGVVSIGRCVFRDYTDLTSIHLPNSLKIIDWGAFEYCQNLISINIPEGITTIGDKAFYGCKSLVSLTIPSSVKKIGDEAFENIPNVNYRGSHYANWGAKTLNGTIDGDFVYADTEKTKLTAYIGISTDIVIPQGVTNIGNYVFTGYEKIIKNVTIPQSVKSIDYATFAFCVRLKTINVPESVTKIGEHAFADVANVNYGGSAMGSPWDARTRNGIVKGDFVFDDVEQTQLTAYIGEDSIANIPQGVKNIHIKTFAWCENLKKLIIPKTVTSIGKNAFIGCNKVSDVYCYANPIYLSWDGDGFMRNAGTKFHVPADLLAQYERIFGEDANVEFIGDL